MPIYEYKCKRCRRVTEIMSNVHDRPEKMKCKCGKTAKRVLSRSATLTDGDVTWLASAREVLQPSYERPIETRGEYNKYLKSRNIECIG